MAALLHGIGLNLSLLLSPGVQNMFVLEQSILYRRILIVCGISAFCDFALIAVGVFGVGPHFSTNPMISNLLIISGVLMLSLHIFRTLHTKTIPALQSSGEDMYFRNGAIFKTLSFSLLNPSVYLDTIGLLGAAGAFYSAPENISFWLGASVTSCVWFFSVGILGQKAAGIFQSEKNLKIIKIVSSSLMLLSALFLLQKLRLEF